MLSVLSVLYIPLVSLHQPLSDGSEIKKLADDHVCLLSISRKNNNYSPLAKCNIMPKNINEFTFNFFFNICGGLPTFAFLFYCNYFGLHVLRLP